MTTATRIELPHSYSEDFAAHPELPGWFEARRKAAFARFRESGFPTARRGNEPWKYTSVSAPARLAFKLDTSRAEAPTQAALTQRLPLPSAWHTFVVVNGQVVTAPSVGGPVVVSTLAQALKSHGQLVERHFGAQIVGETDPFTDLNTAFATAGIFIHVPADITVEAPIYLIFLSTQRGVLTVSHPRVLVVAERNSRVQLVESYSGAGEQSYLTNAVTEMSLGEGATVEQYRVVEEGASAYHVGSTFVRQGRSSQFKGLALAAGGALVRNNVIVALEGEGSTCDLKGLSFTSGKQHLDNNISVDHSVPRTSSKQQYKGILDGQSKTVFGGRVLVRETALQAEAQQSDRNLLLSRGAEVDSKPSLEIYTDDVKANHGATAGQLDESSLFYLMSRGLSQEESRRLLVQGFGREIIDAIPLEPLREYADRLFGRLAEQAGRERLA